MSKTKKIMSQEEISVFCQQVSMIISAGLPTYYGILILRDETSDTNTKALLNQIYEPMEGGATLHEALKQTGVFPAYMVHMIQLGEETGRLEEVLSSLSVYYEREAEIRSGIRHAITYPLIMTFLMIAVIFVMILKVVPVFKQVYEQLGTELSGSALTLMRISDIMNQYLLVFVGIFVVAILIALLLYRTNLGKTLLAGGKLSLTIASSRFANCMHLALASGLDSEYGMDLASELVNNPHMQERIRKCKEHIAHGEGLSRSLTMSCIFSEIYSSWLAVGYRTGTMDEIMKKISDAYEDETNIRIQRFASMLEPTLIIMLCFFIGVILISFLLPLLGIVSSIG